MPQVAVASSRRQTIVTRGDAARRRRARNPAPLGGVVRSPPLGERVPPPPDEVPLDVELLGGALDGEDEAESAGLGQPIGPKPFTYPANPQQQYTAQVMGQGELGYSALLHPQVYSQHGSAPSFSAYGSPGMHNGNGADLQFVLKLSGFFVLAAYAVLAVIFFLIMHLSRQREISQYTRPQLTPRFTDDERARQYQHPGVLQGSAKASLQVPPLPGPPGGLRTGVRVAVDQSCSSSTERITHHVH